MTDARTLIAIGRLDQALARIEAAARAAPAADPELARRHERLRARTRDAVAALDRLIGER